MPNSTRQFHETVFGYILVGILIALVSWFIERTIEQRGSPPASSGSQSTPTEAPESQTETLSGETPVEAPEEIDNETRKAGSREEHPKPTTISESAPDSTSEQDNTTSRPSLASELTVTAHTESGQRYPLHVRLAELSTTAISTKAKISLTNMSSDVLYYKIYYYHEIGGGIAGSDRFSLVGSDGVSQDWREVEGVKEASPVSYLKNACLLLPPSVEVSVTFGYEKQSPPGQVVVVHTPVRLSQWAPCPGTEIELPAFTLAGNV